MNRSHWLSLKDFRTKYEDFFYKYFIDAPQQGFSGTTN